MKQATAREVSLTAATVGKPLFPTSGEMKYLVLLGGQGGQKGTVVTAATGNEAADRALALNPGWKVVYVGPAADAPPAITMDAN